MTPHRWCLCWHAFKQVKEHSELSGGGSGGHCTGHSFLCFPNLSTFSKTWKVSTTVHLNFIVYFQHALPHKGFDMYMAKPNSEKKSPTIYVTDHGKRQVVCSVDKTSWNGNGKMSHATGIPSSLNLCTLPFIYVCSIGFIIAVMSNLQFTRKAQQSKQLPGWQVIASLCFWLAEADTVVAVQ